MNFDSIPFVANMTPSGAPPSSFRADYRGAARISSGDISFDSGQQLVTSVPIGPASERDVLYVLLSTRAFGALSSASATLGGQSGTRLSVVQSGGGGPELAQTVLFRFTGVTGDSPVTLDLNPGSIVIGPHVAVMSALNVVSENIVTHSGTTGTITLNQSVIADDVIFAAGTMGTSGFADTGNFTTTGMTEQLDRRGVSDNDEIAAVIGTHVATGTESPRTMTFAPAAGAESSGISLRLRG
jgi:hypothetical protein